jgi:hypothetical protein
MELNDQFHEIFPPIPILGMVHLAGEKPIEQAVEEIALYEELGVDGAIIENYHADKHEVYKTLEACFKRTTELVLGVNVLPNEYNISMHWGDMWGAKFVQVDHVAGRYGKGELNLPGYKAYKSDIPRRLFWVVSGLSIMSLLLIPIWRMTSSREWREPKQLW